MPKKNRKRKVPVTQIATKTTNNNNNKKSKNEIKENVGNTNNSNNTNKNNENNGNVIKDITWTHDPLEVFKWLIHPITPQKFFDEYWEKKPLVIKRNNKDYYNNIFSKKELDTILNTRDIFLRRNLNICRCVDGKKVLYEPEINDDTIVDVNEKGEEFVKLEAKQVWDLYNKKGNTIQFYQPQQYSEHLSMIMSKLESFFGCLVGSNSYFTPVGTQGLAPHYDDVEVFVLQLEGSKNWNLYKVFKDLPCVYSPDFEKEKLGKPAQTINLQQGDFLYFPRGTIHEAMSPKNVESHHLTMSTYQNNNFKEFLTGTIQNALNDAFDEDKEYREGMPLNYFSILGNINKSEKSGKPVDTKEKLPSFFSSTVSNNDKLKYRSLFQNKLLTLFRRLEKYLDIDKIADETSLDFVVNRLPPLSAQSIPPHPPLQRGMMDDEDEEEESDEEGDEAPQLIKEKGSKKKPVNDKEDKDDDDDDDDDEDNDENLEAIWSTAPNSDKQSVRLVNPDLLRILRNTTNPTHSFINEPKDECIEVFTSVLNQNDQHMSGHEKIPVSVPFTLSFEESLKFLVSSYPKFVKIKSLPLKDSEERLALSVGLWNIGALEIQN